MHDCMDFSVSWPDVNEWIVSEHVRPCVAVEDFKSTEYASIISESQILYSIR
jgi:hypothetical protein